MTTQNRAPHMELIEVTPEMALDLLTRNTHNRTVRQSQVMQLADAMLSGKFLFNGEPIRIDHNNRIIDGQHRLYAIVESEVPQDLVIWYDLDPDVVHVTDTGIKRSFNDALKMQGEKSVNQISGITTLYYFWQLGLRGQFLFTPNWDPKVVMPQIPDLLSFFNQHRDDILESNRVGGGIRRRVPVTSRTIGLVYLVLNQIDQADANEFLTRLEMGDGLSQTDPIYVLRERLSLDASKVIHKTPTAVTLGLIFKAWNFWRDGQQVQVLRYNPGGKVQEAFPEPH